MSRDDAQREAARRNGELTHGSRHRWFARANKDGDWSLVKVAGLAGAPVDPLKTAVEAKPTPSPQDDPRPNLWRDTGGPWAGSI
jgi:hypothetical protein